MAGHSQFKNIMHRKGAQDKKRAKAFAKFGKEIQIAVKLSGDDVSSNSRLRGAIAAAKAENMPKENIDRAIKKGSGELQADDITEIRYEGYGISGVAMIVECLTDNKNRSASEVRSAFTMHNGTLASSGAVAFQFDHLGQIEYDNINSQTEETIFDLAIEAKAIDVEFNLPSVYIYCPYEDLHNVAENLNKTLGEPKVSRLVWKPKNTVNLNLTDAEKIQKMINSLEDLDDVQEVFANYEISQEVLDKLASKA